MLLYVYTTPPTATVALTLDSGAIAEADAPTTAHGRDDAHGLELPDDTPYQGASLLVEAPGYVLFEGRGKFIPNAAGEAAFEYDDVHLTPTPVPTPPDRGPAPPNPTDPFAVIMWVYEGGTGVTFDLETKEGCGTFTEACARTLFMWTSLMWGHLAKVPGQNQWHQHAVDAIHCLAGEHVGVWDIIYSTESPDAKPCFNFAGPVDPSMWYPPIPGVPVPQKVTRAR